ncbi:MAG TPA: hypothetical protein VE441_08550 [Mycobacterium sp.]|jgi:hypothetical protein|nr:hypothetical protein [Mycobacterium sp.]
MTAQTSPIASGRPTRFARSRNIAALTGLILGGILLLASLVVGIVNREVLDAGRFSRHVDAIRTDSNVSTQVGAEITNRVLALDPDLVALRPVIQTAATTLVRSPAFTPIVATLARQLHRALTRPQSQQIILRLADVGAVLVPTLRALAPDLAAQLPADFDVTLAHVGAQDFAGQTIRAAHTVELLSWLLPLLSAVLLLGSVAAATNRYRMLARVGWAIVAVGIALGVLDVIADALAATTDVNTLSGAITRAAYREFRSPVRPIVVAVIVAGAAIALTVTGRVAEAGGQAVTWGQRVGTRAWSALRSRPTSSRGRAARALVLAAAGLFLLFEPEGAGRLLALVAGLALLAVAAAGYAPQRGTGYIAAAPPPEEPPAARRRGWRAPVAVAAIAALLVAAVISVMARPTLGDDPPPTSALPAQTCNGYAALCDRPFNDVAFPATHNAMAAADESSWLFAEQPDGIIAQLNAGIRVLLIDTWPGEPTQRDGIVITTHSLHARALAQANEDLGPAAVASALRVRDALDLTPTGPPQPYLCHGLCELGATPWEPVMAQLKTWLQNHPRDVVTLFIQDEGVSPEQTNQVFSKAGLLPYVHTQHEGQPWPTLGQMITSGQRLVVLMENQDGGAAYPWQLPGFTWTQDTPFNYTNADQFSCARLRGEPDSPLLLINHWLSNKLRRVTDSAAVNAHDVLWPRVRECEQERHQLPNFVAVNFYNEGDLLQVVDQLNGVG